MNPKLLGLESSGIPGFPGSVPEGGSHLPGDRLIPGRLREENPRPAGGDPGTGWVLDPQDRIRDRWNGIWELRDPQDVIRELWNGIRGLWSGIWELRDP